jgi:Xaa-Pro aminopeptidase
MLTAEGCRGRRDRLWEALPEKPDCIVLSSPRHLVYFASFYASPFVYSSQNLSALLILTRDGRSILVADNVAKRFAQATHVDDVLEAGWYDGRHTAGSRDGAIQVAAVEKLKQLGAGRIGYERDTPYWPLVETGRDAIRLSCGTIAGMQRSKDPDEMELMRRSIRAGEAGHKAAMEGIKPGMTELQAYELIANAAMEAAGEQVIVYGDFASGPNAAKGGGAPTGRTIEKDDLFILDYSVVVRGYRGDFTNTFVVDGGKATSRQKELESACLDAMSVAEKLLRPGAACREVDAAARNTLTSHNPSYTLRHHVGHGVGLGHPDPPYIVPESSETLQLGDVITLEPGQYHEGIGGMRFERNYLITEDGYENLTHHFMGLEPRA